MIAIFQLDVNHWQAVDQQGDIPAAVSVHFVLFVKLNLMNYFIDGGATGNIGPIEHHRIHLSQTGIFALDSYTGDTIFPHEPFSGIIERRKTKLVLHLLEFAVGQWMFIKQVLIVLY